MLTIERSLNVYASDIPQIINLSQYDDDFSLVFSLYTSEGVFTVPSGTTAEIMGTKVDGNGYSADATISGNTVAVTGNNQMTACAGRNIFEIVLTNSSKRLATINFILQVERAALDADTIQSETVLMELNAIIESASTATQAAEDAEDAADRAEEAARTLTIDPTLTQSGQAADAKATGDEINDLREDLKYWDAIPVDNINVSILEKGSWSGAKKDTYKQAYRARSASFLYALDNIDVSVKDRSAEARFLVTIYSVTKVVINNTGWTTSYRIPKGSIFTVILTNSNASTATEKTVEEIYSMFEFVTDTKDVIDSTDDDITACIGTPENPSNKFQAFYPTRLTMLDYIKCDKRLLKVQSTNGYKYYFIGYDESFNVKKFNIHGGGFKTGLNYIDVSDYAYVRVVLANSTDTAVTVEDIENISIEKSVPLLLDECDNTIKSYAKDGINQERKAYAPMYPQSSIVSFQKAFDQGFRSLLLHLQFTADNKMVVLHDLIIDNSAVNSDGTAITGSLRVDSLTLAQLDQYDFGLKFGEEYRGTKITRFADALMWAKKHNVYISIEQIDSNVTNAQLDLMCNALKTYGYIRGNACYWSTKFVNVNYVHGILPDIDLSLTLGSAEAITAWAERFANLKGRSNNVIFYEELSTLTNAVVATLAQYGIEAMTQDWQNAEPDNIINIVNTQPYVSRIVSQIIPAQFALLT